MTAILDDMGNSPMDLPLGNLILKVHPITLNDIIKVRERIRETRLKLTIGAATSSAERLEMAIALSREPVAPGEEFTFFQSYEGLRYLLYLLHVGDPISEERIGAEISISNLRSVSEAVAAYLSSSEAGPSDPPENPSAST